MKRPQIIVSIIGLFLVGALYFYAPRFKKSESAENKSSVDNQLVTNKSVIESAKTSLSASQKITLLSIENQLDKSKSTEDSIHFTRKLIQFWADSAQKIAPYLYYTYLDALLENTEKSLTFAAQQLITNVINPEAPLTLQKWMAGNARVLLEKALIINPKNDSAQINLGACYLFGNISDNPMQGIMKIKSVLDKDSLNVYGQYMLALGGKKSGQYDKAIDRFTKVIQLAPNHVEAMVHLAECYELNNQKNKAIEWYTHIRDIIDNQDAQKALNKKIQELKK
mgnify:CR=1 FL=1